jgi:hypothetical protein
MASTEAVSASFANGYTRYGASTLPTDLRKHLDFSWAPPLLEEAIHAGRRVKVIIIGAGFSGMCAAITLRELCQDVDIVIYDKATDVGGVCELIIRQRLTIGHQNRYAGVACDVPSHSYQYSFCENTQWSAFYASGREIHQYLRRVADQYHLRKLMKVSGRIGVLLTVATTRDCLCPVARGGEQVVGQCHGFEHAGDDDGVWGFRGLCHGVAVQTSVAQDAW